MLKTSIIQAERRTGLNPLRFNCDLAHKFWGKGVLCSMKCQARADWPKQRGHRSPPGLRTPSLGQRAPTSRWRRAWAATTLSIQRRPFISAHLLQPLADLCQASVVRIIADPTLILLFLLLGRMELKRYSSTRFRCRRTMFISFSFLCRVRRLMLSISAASVRLLPLRSRASMIICFSM